MEMHAFTRSLVQNITIHHLRFTEPTPGQSCITKSSTCEISSKSERGLCGTPVILTLPFAARRHRVRRGVRVSGGEPVVHREHPPYHHLLLLHVLVAIQVELGLEFAALFSHSGHHKKPQHTHPQPHAPFWPKSTRFHVNLVTEAYNKKNTHTHRHKAVWCLQVFGKVSNASVTHHTSWESRQVHQNINTHTEMCEDTRSVTTAAKTWH